MYSGFGQLSRTEKGKAKPSVTNGCCALRMGGRPQAGGSFLLCPLWVR